MSSSEVSMFYNWQNCKRCNLANGSFESTVCNVPLESTRGLASTIYASFWGSQLYIKKSFKKYNKIKYLHIRPQNPNPNFTKIKTEN